MPVSRNSPTPVIEEVRPSNAASYDKSTTSPVPSSPKTVHFADPASGFERSTRPATNLEEWSAWLFEDHASRCVRCEDPIATHRRGQHLCEIGHPLACDVALHFHDHAGKIYSSQLDEKHQPVRVELNPGYTRTRLLLKSLAQSHQRSHHRIDQETPRASHREHKSKSKRYHIDESHQVAALVEPFNNTSLHDRHHHHHHHNTSTSKHATSKSNHRSTRHDRTAAGHDLDSRGSLYESDMRRSRRDKGYRVEVRTPTPPHEYGSEGLRELQRAALWRERSAAGTRMGYFM